jgi:hypothetical protein
VPVDSVIAPLVGPPPPSKIGCAAVWLVNVLADVRTINVLFKVESFIASVIPCAVMRNSTIDPEGNPTAEVPSCARAIPRVSVDLEVTLIISKDPLVEVIVA